MTTVTQQSDYVGSRSTSSLGAGNEHRYTGMLIATGASAGLWGLLAAAVWSVFNLFG